MADANTPRRKVLLVGWDAADWKIICPLIDAGKMPHIGRLVQTGCTAAITTLQPSFSPMLWTSIATGKRPFHHGVHGFTEPRPDGKGVHRITNLSRKCKALWNILGQNDLRSIVVGWWPSYPAEPINGVMVSDQFQRVSPDFRMVAGMFHPPELAESLAAFRLNPEDLTADLIEFFVPRAREVDQSRDHRLFTVARIAAECANIQGAATWLMDREPWDLCAVYFDAIDHFGHAFMKFNPPLRPGIGEEDFALYRDVVQAGYRLHDKMLGTLLDKAGDDATVILLSDHGFHPDQLRPVFIPQVHGGPASEHRNNGIFVISGPGIRGGEVIPGVNLLDITPTVLTLFGLPAGADMDGQTLSGVFETAPGTEHIPSWEKVEGADGRHPPHMQLEPMAAIESLDQLVALGYVEAPDVDFETTVKRTVGDLRTNLAEAFQDAGRHAEAAAILRELREADADDQRVALRLFLSAQALRQTSEMATIAEDWAGRRRELYECALARVDELRGIARDNRARRAAQDADEPLLNPEHRAELKRLRRDCRYDPSLAAYFQAQVFRVKRRWSDALSCLDRIPSVDLIRPGLFTDHAELLGRLNRWHEAELTIQKGIASDSSDARVHFAGCRVALHLGDFTSAAHSALDGLTLLYQDPRGHYLLGIALTRLARYEEATLAFRRALSVNPNFPRAHLWLARIYRRGLANRQNATVHSRLYRELCAGKTPAHTEARPAGPPPRPVQFAASARELPPISDEVVIVSGLPRSGTSMLMQMLVAGGLTPLADGLREPDEDNPRGYFEFEPVKQMAQDSSWIAQARGKVVKIVAPMIPSLPDGVPCRVILVERNLDEVLASQRQMIARLGRRTDQTPARLDRLKREYLRLIVWTKGFLSSRPETHLMCLDRGAILRNPHSAAILMNRFLGRSLDTSRMAAEVRPELDRQKSSASNSTNGT